MSIPVDRLTEALSGRYRVIRELASGGMATVYVAQDLRHDRQVAIKVLRPDVASAIGAERFLREIRIAARLQHPMILPLHDSGEADELLFYVMPLVRGDSLQQRLEQERRIPIEEAVPYLADLLEALSYAHRQGIVHRDVKPGNVLLSDAHVLLADFGVAKALSDASGLAGSTTAGMSLGTPRYMSPEQAAGDRDVDHRSDLYSVGVIAYEMLTGNPPFRGDSARAIMSAHVTQQPTPVAELNAEVPEALADAVMKALKKDPAERWDTADEFLAEVRAVAATPAGGVQSVGGVRKRGLPGWAAAAAVVVVGTGWFGYSQYRAAADLRWVREEAIPRIQEHIAADEPFDAWQLAREVESRVPGDPELERIERLYNYRTELSSDPSEASVSIRRYGIEDAPWVDVGFTPEVVRLPRTYLEIRVEKPGYETIEFPTLPWRLESVILPASGSDLAAELEAGMVLIPVDRAAIQLPGLDHLPAEALAPYLIDRYEVTNRQFKAFVDAGGYDRRELWVHPFTDGEGELTWEEAQARFVDRTGRRGPATWEAGDYADGDGDLPVGGISWYEADAYARFVGKDLPTVFHWAWAADTWASAWIVPRSNIGGREGPVPVGSSGARGTYGLYDMAGNVREWTSNASANGRYILGGGWDDALYGFNDAYAQSSFDRTVTNGVRLFRRLGEDAGDPEKPLILAQRDFSAETPASDELFEAYLQSYAYDPTPLDPVVEDTDGSHPDWTYELVSITTAYGERMPVHLYLPKGHAPPYQTIVFFPGSGAIHNRSSRNLGTGLFDFFLKNGRAFAWPVYKSTFERGDELHSDVSSETQFWRNHVIQWVQDYRRTVDYLETREELDTEKLAYFGFSWGGYMGGIIPAVETRIKVSVLYVAGVTPQRGLPEVEPLNFLPRVTIPTLMLNGEQDHFFPLETAQRPMFELLGTPDSMKVWEVHKGGHNVPRAVLIRESLDWLDKYLGPVR